MKKWKVGLLARVAIAIVLGIVSGLFFPVWAQRIFLTFNALFNSFLNFIVPLVILGLIAPGIAELGKGAGKMLGTTLGLAYGSTLLSGFFAYFICRAVYPVLLTGNGSVLSLATETTAGLTENAEQLTPFFTLDFPPLFGDRKSVV